MAPVFEEITAGAQVVVVEPFKTNQKTNSLELKTGITGTVAGLDKDGDAQILFDLENSTSKQWVFKSHFSKIQVTADVSNQGQKRKLDACHIVEGGRVVVVDAFKSNQKNNSMQMNVGLIGTVLKIDKDGDAQISFDVENSTTKQWVFKANFQKLGDPNAISEPEPQHEQTLEPNAISEPEPQHEQTLEPSAKRQRTGSWFLCRRRAAASGA